MYRSPDVPRLKSLASLGIPTRSSPLSDAEARRFTAGEPRHPTVTPAPDRNATASRSSTTPRIVTFRCKTAVHEASLRPCEASRRRRASSRTRDQPNRSRACDSTTTGRCTEPSPYRAAVCVQIPRRGVLSGRSSFAEARPESSIPVRQATVASSEGSANNIPLRRTELN